MAMNEKGKYSVVFEKKSEGDVGPGPMGLGGNISFS